MNEPERRRFYELFAWSLLGFAFLFSLLGNHWSQSEYALSWIPQHAVGMFGPVVVGSAFLLALVLWAVPLSGALLQSQLKRILFRGLMVSVPGYAVACALVVAVQVLMQVALGAPLSAARDGLARLSLSFLYRGLVSTACDVGLVAFLAWRFLPRLHASRDSLPAKLVLVLTVSAPLRVTLALVVTSLWPS
ncbi:MAG TPA: hypothetical protein VHB79_25770 [Polyangiaceae bacterium]|nr:hypothetical protein [Polyangiaceae bacterium]